MSEGFVWMETKEGIWLLGAGLFMIGAAAIVFVRMKWLEFRRTKGNRRGPDPVVLKAIEDISEDIAKLSKQHDQLGKKLDESFAQSAKNTESINRVESAVKDFKETVWSAIEVLRDRISATEGDIKVVKDRTGGNHR